MPPRAAAERILTGESVSRAVPAATGVTVLAALLVESAWETTGAAVTLIEEVGRVFAGEPPSDSWVSVRLTCQPAPVPRGSITLAMAHVVDADC